MRIGMNPQPVRSYTVRPDWAVADFKRHLETLGDPSQCHFISNEKPPAKGIVVLYPGFVIPERHVARDGLARCPICSPKAPKYATGHLLWSPVNGKIYAVGHCCGHKYFIGGELAHELREAKARASRRVDEEFLLLNWDRVSVFGEFALALKARAREFDQTVKRLVSGISQSRANEVFRIASAGGGHLSVVHQNETPTDGPGGLSGIRSRFGDRPLAGYQILHRPRSAPSAEARLANAGTAFQFVEWDTHDAAYAWLCDMPDRDLRILAGRLRDAEGWYEEVCSEMASLAAFLPRSNLALLTAWSRCQDSLQSQFGITRPTDTTLKIWRPGHAIRPIVLPASVERPVPEPPKLN
jgi:hypothetical protein